MLEARKIKSDDELALLDQAAGIVDAVYDEIYRTLRPGVTENQIVAQAMKTLFELGSEHVEAINAISGDRCNPHPHTFADRLLRPGDQAFFDIIHAFMGYRTCYYRTFNVGYATPSQLDAYKRCREWLDAAISMVRPGNHHRQDRRGLARGHGARLRRRARRLRASVRARARRRPVRGADDLAPALVRRARRDRGRDGVRARDLLPGLRRPLRRPDRGGGRRHARRARGDHALPRAGPARGGQDLRPRDRPRRRARRQDRATGLSASLEAVAAARRRASSPTTRRREDGTTPQ